MQKDSWIPVLDHTGYRLPCLTFKMAAPWPHPSAGHRGHLQWAVSHTSMASCFSHLQLFLPEALATGASSAWTDPTSRARELWLQPIRMDRSQWRKIAGDSEICYSQPKALPRVFSRMKPWRSIATHSLTHALLAFLPSFLTHPLSTCACWVQLQRTLITLESLPQSAF